MAAVLAEVSNAFETDLFITGHRTSIVGLDVQPNVLDAVLQKFQAQARRDGRRQSLTAHIGPGCDITEGCNAVTPGVDVNARHACEGVTTTHAKVKVCIEHPWDEPVVFITGRV